MRKEFTKFNPFKISVTWGRWWLKRKEKQHFMKEKKNSKNIKKMVLHKSSRQRIGENNNDIHLLLTLHSGWAGTLAWCYYPSLLHPSLHPPQAQKRKLSWEALKHLCSLLGGRLSLHFFSKHASLTIN